MCEKLLKLYEDLLNFAKCEVNKEGYIHSVINDKRVPFLVDGKHVVMPTREHLRNAIDKVIFHPLRENLMRGESEVFKTYRNTLTLRLNVAAASISQYLLNVAASPDLQKNLTSEQTDLVVSLGDVDNKSLENFMKIILNASKADPYKTFISFYTRRGGVLMGKKHARVCVVTFPIYEMLVAGDEKVHGVKIRNRDRDTYIKLYKFMYPEVDQQDAYSSGSDSRVAPYMDCLLSSAMKVAACYNDLTRLYGEYIDGSEDLEFASDWVEAMGDLDSLSNSILHIPTQAGNEGSPKAEESTHSAPVPTVQVEQNACMQPVQYQVPQAQQPVPVAPKQPNQHMSVKELLASNPATAYVPPPPYMQQQMMPPMMAQRAPGWSQPNMTPMVPQYPQGMQPMMPGMMPNMVPQYGQPMQPMMSHYPTQQMQPGYQPPWR